MSEPTHRWLHLYAWGVVCATFFLIFVGAMVTSKDAGLAVPDWPLSYGSLNPPGWWRVENVFWEHGHRLVGAAIGLLTIGLTVALWRVHRRSWLRWLGVLALVGVCVQGLMGGLRVTQMSVSLAIVHACFAQAFFALVLLIAALTSPRMQMRPWLGDPRGLRVLRGLAVAFAASIYLQLIFGATMRHLKVGLAIPDFPLSMGRWIPEFTHYGITVAFAHRAWAVAIFGLAIALLVVVLRGFRKERALVAAAAVSAGLVVLQVALGAAVIWMTKAPFPTSLHVLNGAAVLGGAIFVLVRAFSLVPRGALLARPDASGTREERAAS